MAFKNVRPRQVKGALPYRIDDPNVERNLQDIMRQVIELQPNGPRIFSADRIWNPHPDNPDAYQLTVFYTPNNLVHSTQLDISYVDAHGITQPGGGPAAGSLETITDDFTVLDTSNDWDVIVASGWQGTATLEAVNGRLEIKPGTVSDGSGDYACVARKTNGELNDSFAAVEVAQVCTNSGISSYFTLKKDAANPDRLAISYLNGNLRAEKRVAGVNSTVATITYDAREHRWWRIRETSDKVFWETSPNGRDWTTFHSEATPWTGAISMQVELCIDSNTTDMTDRTPFTVDNLNLVVDGASRVFHKGNSYSFPQQFDGRESDFTVVFTPYLEEEVNKDTGEPTDTLTAAELQVREKKLQFDGANYAATAQSLESFTVLPVVDKNGVVSVQIGAETSQSFKYAVSTSAFPSTSTSGAINLTGGSYTYTLNPGVTLEPGDNFYISVWFYTNLDGTGQQSARQTGLVQFVLAEIPYFSTPRWVALVRTADFSVDVVDPLSKGGTVKVWSNKAGDTTPNPKVDAPDGEINLGAPATIGPSTAATNATFPLDNIPYAFDAEKSIYLEYITTDGRSTGVREFKVQHKWDTLDPDGRIRNASSFAAGIEPVRVVGVLPTVKETETVFLTTDAKLYRWNGTAYIRSIPTTDLSGVIISSQLYSGAVEADKIQAGNIAAGVISVDHLVGNSAELTNLWVNNQINASAVNATSLSAITATLGTVAAGKITSPDGVSIVVDLTANAGTTYFIDSPSFKVTHNGVVTATGASITGTLQLEAAIDLWTSGSTVKFYITELASTVGYLYAYAQDFGGPVHRGIKIALASNGDGITVKDDGSGTPVTTIDLVADNVLVNGSPISSGGGAVSSVFGRTGDVSAQSGDYAAHYLALSGGVITGELQIEYTGSDLFSTLKGPTNRTLRIDIPGNDINDGVEIRTSYTTGGALSTVAKFARIPTFYLSEGRMELWGNASGSTNVAYIGFYDSGGVRKGYFGDTSSSNSTIALAAEAGALRLIGYQSGGYVDIGAVDGWPIRIENSYGYIHFGPANTGWAHIYSDRPGFYFNQDIVAGGTGNFLGQNGAGKMKLSDTQAAFYTSAGAALLGRFKSLVLSTSYGTDGGTHTLFVNGTTKLTSTVYFANDVWHGSGTDGASRFYFANGGHTYLRAGGTGSIYFRTGANTTIMELNNSLTVKFYGNPRDQYDTDIASVVISNSTPSGTRRGGTIWIQY